MRQNVTRLGQWSLLAAGVTAVAALCVAVILLAGSRTPLSKLVAARYPKMGREPSTPPGDSALSLRMAREMTRRCISLVPS